MPATLAIVAIVALVAFALAGWLAYAFARAHLRRTVALLKRVDERIRALALVPIEGVAHVVVCAGQRVEIVIRVAGGRTGQLSMSSAEAEWLSRELLQAARPKDDARPLAPTAHQHHGA